MELEVPRFVRNFRLSSTGYYSAYGWGLYSCARFCGRQAGCKSFTYKTEDLGCRFIEEDATTEPGQYTESSGYIYGDRKTILPNEPLMGSCRDHSCPDYQTCFRLSSGSTVCLVTVCGPTPGVPVNVDISPTMGLVGSPRQLHCDSGYQGFRTVTCLSNGNWSETENNCTGLSDCGDPPGVTHAVISVGHTTMGSTRSYQCIAETIPSGSGDITCQQDGNWSASSLVCVPDCGTPSSLSNATVSNGNTTLGSTRTYECIPTSIASGSGNITCQQDGMWSASSLVCVPGCGDPQVISNAIVSTGNTTIGSNRTYECIPTSTASGSGDITCQSNGTWTSPSLVCIPDCVIDPVTQNAQTTATRAPANSLTLYTCITNYVQASGSGYRVCSPNGVWSTFDISCIYSAQNALVAMDGDGAAHT
ncbi:sushi, von Willebrand factor type A, EGF and pentraxin domain-containing protein 1-like [Argopecten irradians]|uniref:sushi, von Willebrand factor type A, EGF and pentraxin domain-containing protein 1-like n=1 Tax=Argopecten irradians TaxID=31199 RepID=UPI003716AA9D